MEVQPLPLLTHAQELSLGFTIQSSLTQETQIKARLKEAEQTDNLPPWFYDRNQTLLADTKKVKDQAITTFIEHNRGLALRRVTRWENMRWTSYLCGREELMAAAEQGLLEGALKFDPTKGNKFSTVAVFWMDHHIKREFQNNGRLIKIPVKISSLVPLVSLVADRLKAKDRLVRPELIARFINYKYFCEGKNSRFDVDDILNAQLASKVSIIRVHKTNDEGVEYSLFDQIADPNAELDFEDTPTPPINKEELVKLLRDSLGDTLSDILMAKFKVNGLTPEEVAAKHKVSLFRMRRWVAKALQTAQRSPVIRDRIAKLV